MNEQIAGLCIYWAKYLNFSKFGLLLVRLWVPHQISSEGNLVAWYIQHSENSKINLKDTSTKIKARIYSFKVKVKLKINLDLSVRSYFAQWALWNQFLSDFQILYWIWTQLFIQPQGWQGSQKKQNGREKFESVNDVQIQPDLDKVEKKNWKNQQKT